MIDFFLARTDAASTCYVDVRAVKSPSSHHSSPLLLGSDMRSGRTLLRSRSQSYGLFGKTSGGCWVCSALPIASSEETATSATGSDTMIDILQLSPRSRVKSGLNEPELFFVLVVLASHYVLFWQMPSQDFYGDEGTNIAPIACSSRCDPNFPAPRCIQVLRTRLGPICCGDSSNC